MWVLGLSITKTYVITIISHIRSEIWVNMGMKKEQE